LLVVIGGCSSRQDGSPTASSVVRSSTSTTLEEKLTTTTEPEVTTTAAPTTTTTAAAPATVDHPVIVAGAPEISRRLDQLQLDIDALVECVSGAPCPEQLDMKLQMADDAEAISTFLAGEIESALPGGKLPGPLAETRRLLGNIARDRAEIDACKGVCQGAEARLFNNLRNLSATRFDWQEIG
jgi:hypothetical protein